MRATVKIEKSFDESIEFSKEWGAGDLEEFLKDEGVYLDKLGGMLAAAGKEGDSFTVTYTVKVVK